MRQIKTWVFAALTALLFAPSALAAELNEQVGNKAKALSVLPYLLFEESGDNSPYEGLAIQVDTSTWGHSCALLSDGRVMCWGFNDDGQLGTGNFTSTSVPRAVIGIKSAVDIFVGFRTTCALLESGEVWCWGLIFGGLSEREEWFSTSKPVKVPNSENTAQLSRYCGLRVDGSINCWNGSVPTSGIDDDIILYEADGSSCVLQADQTMKCWGDNRSGSLGDGTTTSSSEAAVSVLGLDDITAITSPTRGSTKCAISAADGIYCWGSNTYGNIGNGSRDRFSSVPVLVNNTASAIQISTNFTHTCAVFSEGNIKCWGRNSRGTLGDGTTDASRVPVDVIGLPLMKQVSTGSDHNCAVSQAGEVYCWGHGSQGRLGGGNRNNSIVPQKVVGF